MERVLRLWDFFDYSVIDLLKETLWNLFLSHQLSASLMGFWIPKAAIF